MSMMRLVFTLADSGSAQSIVCRSGKPQQVAELMFGRKIGDRIGVSDSAWARFVDREITPRFPDGLTVIDARGQWRDPDRNRIVREPSKLVQIVLPGNEEDQQRLDEIAAALQSPFPSAIRRDHLAAGLRGVLAAR